MHICKNAIRIDSHHCINVHVNTEPKLSRHWVYKTQPPCEFMNNKEFLHEHFIVFIVFFQSILFAI